MLQDVNGLELLCAACILKLMAVFLCCLRICVICLALELVGPCVVLGFSVVVEAFDELLLINVPWNEMRWDQKRREQASQ